MFDQHRTFLFYDCQTTVSRVTLTPTEISCEPDLATVDIASLLQALSDPVRLRYAVRYVNASNQRASFSNWGAQSVDVFAPGSDRAADKWKTDYQIDKQVISTEVGGDFGSLRDELRARGWEVRDGVGFTLARNLKMQ